MRRLFYVLLILLASTFGCDSTENKIKSDIRYQIIEGKTVSEWYQNKTEQVNWLDKAHEKIRNNRGFERADIGENTYLLIKSGLKNSGGNTVSLRQIIINEQLITVVVEDVPPKPGPVPAVRENPSLLIAVERTNKQITVKWIAQLP